MKVTDVKVIPASYQYEGEKTALEKSGSWSWSGKPRSFALVQVHTDEGVVGWGEASGCYGHFYPRVMREIVDEVLKPVLVNEDVSDIERIRLKMRDLTWKWLGHAGALIEAISGVEIALWDALGHSRGEPVYKLLGGCLKSKIPLYAAGTTDHTQSPEWHAKWFDPLLDHGFTTIKIRGGHSLQWDANLVKGVRNSLGENIGIILDVFMSYSAPSATRLAALIEKYNLYYLEEPCLYYDLAGLASVVAKSKVPIGVGEHGYTIHAFRDLIMNRAADVFNPDVTVAGGLQETKNICALADTWGIPVVPHCGGLSAIGLAANLHLSAATQNYGMLEYDGKSWQPLRDELLPNPIFALDYVKDGCLSIPSKPGLGIEINEDVLAKYPYIPPAIERELPNYGVGRL